MRVIQHIIVVILLLMVPFSRIIAQQKESLTISLSKPGKPFTLSFELPTGSIEINSYSGTDILIEAKLMTGKSEPSINTNQNNNQRTNNNLNSILGECVNEEDNKYIKASESGNAITISSLVPKDKLVVIIKVPKSKGIFHLSSMFNTAITASELTGELDINNNAGEIVLNRITGSAVVSNVAGGITASFVSVTNNTPMAFSTVAGKIDISLPSTITANIKVASEQGEFFSDFDLKATAANTEQKLRKTSSGQFHASNAVNLAASAGNGGAEIRFKNMIGNIYLRKSK